MRYIFVFIIFFISSCSLQQPTLEDLKPLDVKKIDVFDMGEEIDAPDACTEGVDC